MDVASIFQIVHFLSLSWISILWLYQLLNKYKEYLLPDVNKNMQMFLALNIVLIIVDKTKQQCPKSSRHMCFYVAKYFVLVFIT